MTHPKTLLFSLSPFSILPPSLLPFPFPFFFFANDFNIKRNSHGTPNSPTKRCKLRSRSAVFFSYFFSCLLWLEKYVCQQELPAVCTVHLHFWARVRDPWPNWHYSATWCYTSDSFEFEPDSNHRSVIAFQFEIRRNSREYAIRCSKLLLTRTDGLHWKWGNQKFLECYLVMVKILHFSCLNILKGLF